MKKKILAVMLSAVMAVTMLVGCGNSAETGGRAETGESREREETSQEEQESGEFAESGVREADRVSLGWQRQVVVGMGIHNHPSRLVNILSYCSIRGH